MTKLEDQLAEALRDEIITGFNVAATPTRKRGCDALAAYDYQQVAESGKTHCAGCWRWHLDCAVAKIDELVTGDNLRAIVSEDTDILLREAAAAHALASEANARIESAPVVTMHADRGGYAQSALDDDAIMALDGKRVALVLVG